MGSLATLEESKEGEIIDFFSHNKIDVLSSVGWVSYFQTDQPEV
jgi:hypothetical protein